MSAPSDTLLVELLTEELPPKALPLLGRAFAELVHTELGGQGLLYQPDEPARVFATPRRLAVQIEHVLSRAADREVCEKIMPIKVALDNNGQPTLALLKKLAAKGMDESAIAQFERRHDGKQDSFFFSQQLAGAQLADILPDIVASAQKRLPAPRLMRWGDSDVQFVRPVHGLLMLHGKKLIQGQAMGLNSSQTALGHRFLSSGDIFIDSAANYESLLHEQGKVVADFGTRRQIIADMLTASAQELCVTLRMDDSLLDEVTALVEWPQVYVGEFDAEFLEVPSECLTLTMQQNQKYFPLFDEAGNLLNRFLIVSNMQVDNPAHIIKGNERVLRPRFADARFFFDQDRRISLQDRLPRLGQVVYHNKLGNQLQRSERLAQLAAAIATKIANANGLSDEAEYIALAQRAGLLCKADLVSGMVGEFPELEGVMGCYYAEHDGEPSAVSEAIAQHYHPRFAGDTLPRGEVACAVALADKLDTLVGLFGIGQTPTGERDPYALRRAALGVLRILLETPLSLDLHSLFGIAAAQYTQTTFQLDTEQLIDFMQERLRGLLRERGFAVEAIDAVLALRLGEVAQIPARLIAVSAFCDLPEAAELAAANKRIGNILRKSDSMTAMVTGLPTYDTGLLRLPAECALGKALNKLTPRVYDRVAHEDYRAALLELAGVKNEVDNFFDQVMVMDEDEHVRRNRLALISSLHGVLNAVADISRLNG